MTSLKCSVCGECFPDQKAFDNHAKIKYVCIMCRMGFSTETKLKDHVKLEHKCGYCKETFTNEFTFLDHMKHIHTKGRYDSAAKRMRVEIPSIEQPASTSSAAPIAMETRTVEELAALRKDFSIFLPQICLKAAEDNGGAKDTLVRKCDWDGHACGVFRREMLCPCCGKTYLVRKAKFADEAAVDGLIDKLRAERSPNYPE